MKKFALLATGLVALGLGVFCACAEDPVVEEEPNNGGTQTDFSEQLGEYDDVRWVCTEGVLDLAAGTFSGAESFAITAVDEGEEIADIVISCTADGAEYTISYDSENGTLNMYDSSSSLVRTFMADASAFAGAWYDEDDTSYYYVMSSTLDEDGYFSWQMCYQSYITTGEPSQAITIFDIQSDGSAGMYFYVPDYDIWYYYYSSGLYMDDGSYSSTALTYYSGVFTTTYMDGDGEFLTINDDGTVTYRGSTSVADESGFGISSDYGAGIYFALDGTQYALIYMTESVYLLSADEVISVAAYYYDWLYVNSDDEDDNEWSSGGGLDYATFADDTQITFNGRTYDMTRGVSEGDLIYTFEAGSTTYVIRPVNGYYDMFAMESSSGTTEYWLRDSAKAEFAGTYTSNAETVEISSDDGMLYYITITDNESDVTTTNTNVTFTYLSDLGSIVLAYPIEYGGVNITLYFAEVNTYGIYWAIAGSNSSYAVYATYFTADYADQIIDEIEGILGESDYFTTGGSTPSTIEFDFDNNTVKVVETDEDGEQTTTTYYFAWGYGYVRSTSEAEVYLDITSDQAEDYSYYNYRVFYSESGLEVVYSHIVVEDNSYTTEDEKDRFYVVHSVLEELVGNKFVYDGQYAQSEIYFDEDGNICISEFDSSDSSATLMTVSDYDYTLTYTAEGNVFTITFENAGTEYHIVITNNMYAAFNSTVYTLEEYADYVGTYYDEDENYISFTSSGGIQVNGRSASVSSISNDGYSVSVTYTISNTQYTAVFAKDSQGNISARVTAGSDGEAVAYTKVTFTPEAFVGTYEVTLGEDSASDGETTSATTYTIDVRTSASDVNSALSFVIRVNGRLVDIPTIQYVDGKQQIRFRWSGITVVDCLMVLNDDGTLTITVTVGEDSTTISKGVASWSYADFELSSSVETENGTLTCVMKTVDDGMRVPLYFLDGVICTDYVVSINGSTKTLTLTCGSYTVTITNDGENVSASVS